MANLPVRASAGLPAGARSFDEMYRQAEILAKSELVRKSLQGKPESIVLVGLFGAEHGISLVTALSQVHIIDNQPSPSAQLQIGQATRLGHQTRWVETSPEKAVLQARKREDRADPAAWVTFTFTIDDARRAGLLDIWVEAWLKDGKYDRKFTWVVGNDQGMHDLTDAPSWAREAAQAGKLKRRDPWFKYPEDMLCARVATRAVKRQFPDALLTLGVDPYAPEVDVDPDSGEVLGEHDADPAPDDGGPEEVIDDAVVLDDLAPEPDLSAPPAGPQTGPAPGETPEPREHPVPAPRPGERYEVTKVKWRRMCLPKPERDDFDAWLANCGIPDSIDISDAKIAALNAELDRRGAPKAEPATTTTDG